MISENLSFCHPRRRRVRAMSDLETPHVCVGTVDDLVVHTPLVTEIRMPIFAASVRKNLSILVDQFGPRRFVFNFKRTKSTSSTVFAMLLNLARRPRLWGDTETLRNGSWGTPRRRHHRPGTVRPD